MKNVKLDEIFDFNAKPISYLNKNMINPDL